MYITNNEIQMIETAQKYIAEFLKDMGQFYPFALIMNTNGLIHTIEPDCNYDDDENRLVNKLIDLYETTFQKELNKRNNEYFLAAICIDICVTNKTNKIKSNAVEIRLINTDSRKVVYLPYIIDNSKQIKFGNLVGK